MPELRAGLRNPTGLVLLALSVAIAGAIIILPPLALWSSRAPWAVVVGVVAYALTVLVYLIQTHPEVSRMLAIRRVMADRLDELRAQRTGRNSALVPVVADAVQHMDSQLVPTFRSIVVRHESLSHHLALYEQGKTAPPDPENLDRLRRIHSRQQEAIDACLRQAANAYATMLALLQEADEDGAVKQAKMWASDLNDMYDGLSEVLSGIDPYEQALQQLRMAGSEAQLVKPLIREALQRVEPLPSGPQSAEPSARASGRAFPRGLTQREAEVLALLAEGLTSKEIADRLVVTLATVSRHIANIYAKIGARGRADATRFALVEGITKLALFPAGDGRVPSFDQAERPSYDNRQRGGATA